ncbi:MAG: type IX secretion system sortase PorU [Bacteroidales bacterium]|jgi:hypothetical protein|nr:type IX secretion system sortase PorU [Bacteroidales bacterium]
MMKLKSWVYFPFFLAIFCYSTDIQAQKNEKNIQLNWVSDYFLYADENETKKVLYFEGALFSDEYDFLPQYYEKLAVNDFYQEYEITISNIKTEPFSAQDELLLTKNYNLTSLEVKINTAIDRKKNFAAISFIPIIKNGSGHFEKVLSFHLVFSGKNPYLAQKSGSVNVSVLNTGTWYKIKTDKTGLHKVTYQDLEALGMNVSNLMASNIALFGNGGGMLPEANSKPRQDDLNEIPLSMFNLDNGKFVASSYFIFYAQGPHTWNFDTISHRFSHKTNFYDDFAYYFINVNPGIGEKKRITSVNNNALTANEQVSQYHHYDFHELEESNPGESGQIWLGERFDVTLSRTFPFSVPSVIAAPSRISINSYSTSASGSSLKISVNNNVVGQISCKAANYPDMNGLGFFSFTTTSSPINVKIDFNRNSSSATAYLDWIEIETECALRMHSAQFPFCNPATIAAGRITEFVIKNADNNTTVWDVTNQNNPVQMQGTLTNGTFSFKSETHTLKKFVAFNKTDYYPIVTVGQINNQNLHGDNDIDLVIVVHPDFANEANRLAAFRHQNDGLSVKTVLVDQIYNEFSSGAQDPTAIRDYLRMIYDRSSAQYPRYLLLFGRPSFDYRGRLSETKNYVPNYQFLHTFYKDNFLSNDDYFGLLDIHEGNNSSDLIDVSVGRFPVATLNQAKVAVDKAINYSKKENLVPNPNATTISNFADWRNVIAFVADDENDNWHIKTADASANIVSDKNQNINLSKIYCDAYPQVSSAGGQRYPDVNLAIENRMKRGAFMVSYVGHGGESRWAHETILELSDINNWSNLYNQPIMTTLTCEFGWYDRPVVSPAEMAFLNSKGGAAGLITTSRVAWITANDTYSKNMFKHLFEKENGQYKRLGDINRAAKNAAPSGSTRIIFTMGDPSMPLALPEYVVVTDSLLDADTKMPLDSIAALSKITVKGHLTNEAGVFLSIFTGNAFPLVYDKPTLITTLSNDPDSPPFTFSQQDKVLFKGNVSVVNGRFEFTFIVPKDINYQYGKGKISYYARTKNSDAAGYYSQFIIGGISNNQYSDSIGPEMEVYLNDENFVNGSIVEPSPTLLLKLQDELGINTTGNGIGHDLVAVLDDHAESPFVLNDYYTADLNSYNSGTVRYPLKNLAIGKHQLKIRAWDILNHLSEKTIFFEVVSDEKLTLNHVLNYPNPFTTHTDFYFEHNQPGEPLEVLISIFTISGKIVKTISQPLITSGNRSNPISWNGRDDYGDKLAKGVYIYRLKVKNSKGEIVEKFEKLVIL